MPPKKKSEPSKKTVQKQKEKVIEVCAGRRCTGIMDLVCNSTFNVI